MSDGETENNGISYKRDALFLSLAGIFLTSLVLGNVIGTTKFVTIFSMELPGWLLSILYMAGNLGSEITTVGALVILIVNSYLFKFFFALFDTSLFLPGGAAVQRLP